MFPIAYAYPLENYRFHWDSNPCIQNCRAPGKFSGVLAKSSAQTHVKTLSYKITESVKF